MNAQFLTLRFAILTIFSLGALFFLMIFFGLEHNSELRILNVFIVLVFSNMLARRNIQENPTLPYINGLASIFIANAITTFACVAGFAIYVEFINTNFLTQVDGGLLWPKNIGLAEACAALFIEGMAGSAITSFVLMQYWKDVKIASKH